MRTIQWLLMFLLSASLASAESAKDAANALRQSMKDSQLILKNFSGEDKVQAAWSGATFELEAPRWRTLGILSVESVTVKGEKLTLHCIRHVVVRDKTDKVVMYAQPDPMEVDVNLNSADPGTALPKLKDALFYPSINEAFAAIPKDLQDVIPARIDKTGSLQTDGSANLKPPCDCADREKAECAAAHNPMDGMVPPKYLHGNDPRITSQARRAQLNGAVNVRLIIGKDGHPVDVWVARPLGLGLDEEAAKSVLSYVFKPAMCHGDPVAVFLSVEVNFEIH